MSLSAAYTNYNKCMQFIEEIETRDHYKIKKNPSDPLAFHFFPVIGDQLNIDREIYANHHVIFRDCPRLGKIHATGIVILMNCPVHEEVTSKSDIFVIDGKKENLHKLTPGNGHEIYICNTKQRDVPLRDEPEELGSPELCKSRLLASPKLPRTNFTRPKVTKKVQLTVQNPEATKVSFHLNNQ